MSLQLDDNHDNDNNHDELQDPNPALDAQSTDPTNDSNAVSVPVRHVEKQDIRRNAEQNPQYLIQGSSTSSTTNTNITQSPIQPPISRKYDPSPLLESDISTSSSTSQQSNTFNNNINGLIYNTRPLHFNLLQLLKIRQLQHINILKHKIPLLQIYRSPLKLT